MAEPEPKCIRQITNRRAQHEIEFVRASLLKNYYIQSIQNIYSYIIACEKVINTIDIDLLINSFTFKELVDIYIVKHKDFSIRHAEQFYELHCEFTKSNKVSPPYKVGYPTEFTDAFSKCPFITDVWLEEHHELISVLHPIILLNSSSSMSYDFIVKHYITSRYKPYICDHIARNFTDISIIKKFNYLVLDMKLVSSSPVVTIDVYLENKDQLAFDVLLIINRLNPRDVLKYHKELGVAPTDTYWYRHTLKFTLEDITEHNFKWDIYVVIGKAIFSGNGAWWFIKKHIKTFEWNFRVLSQLEPPISLVRETMKLFNWDMDAISKSVSEKEFLEHQDFDKWSYNTIAEYNDKISFETCMLFMDNIRPSNKFWYNNTSKFTDISFILSRLTYNWNWGYIIEMGMITDWSFIYKNQDLPADMLWMLSKCKSLPLKVIIDNKKLKWHWELIAERSDISFNFLYLNVSTATTLSFRIAIQAIVSKKIIADSSMELLADELPQELIDYIASYVYY